MDVIADAAAITKVTVYQHFKSKEDLFLQCLRWRLKNREAYLESRFAGKPATVSRVLEIFDWVGEKATKGNFQGCAFLKATNEMAGTLPEVRAVALQAKRLLRKRIVAMLCEARLPNAAVLGDTLALLIEGAQALSLIEQSKRPFKVAKRQAQSLIAPFIDRVSDLSASARVEN